jgi:decaprenyl-phosphate phosphoribosyltransferase
VVLDLLRLARPKQWVKNVLVLAAPGAAGVLTQADQGWRTAAAFVAFCLAASGTYCLNDAADAPQDRLHPKKRHRPVAAGEVSVRTARIGGVVLLAAAVVVSLLPGGWQLLIATGSYVVLTTSYTLWLKHIAVLDLAAVAAGFVVRALAGAAATHVEISKWFIIVASFGSLFMVTGKRASELGASDDAASQRAVLSQYPPEFLAHLRSVAAGVTLLAYTLFAFEKADLTEHGIWFELSIIPFALGILRYMLRLDQGEGGAPEELVLGDRMLLLMGAAWAILFVIGVEVAR